MEWSEEWSEEWSVEWNEEWSVEWGGVKKWNGVQCGTVEWGYGGVEWVGW